MRLLKAEFGAGVLFSPGTPRQMLKLKPLPST